MERNKNGVIEIDLLKVARECVRKAWIIIACTLIGGLIAFLYARFLITPTYQSSVLLYVNNSSQIGIQDDVMRLTSSDITASQNLVNTYIVMLKTRNTLDDVVAKAHLDMSYDEISREVSAAAVNNTEVFKVTVTDPDPLRAEVIANTIAEVFPEKIAGIVEGSSARVVDYAVIPTHRNAPAFTKYTIIGLLLGFIASMIYVIVTMLMDYKIHSEEYLLNTYPDIPLLGSIPEFTNRKGYSKYKYGYGYTYGYQDKKEA